MPSFRSAGGIYPSGDVSITTMHLYRNLREMWGLYHNVLYEGLTSESNPHSK